MNNNLMIVDDDPDILNTMQAIFEPLGYSIFTANNGQECLDTLQKGFHGVILLDIMMPVLDGWDTVRNIVENNLWKDNIIIMLTAVDEPSEKMEGVKEYIIDYITKPFDNDVLIETVKRYSSYL